MQWESCMNNCLCCIINRVCVNLVGFGGMQFEFWNTKYLMQIGEYISLCIRIILLFFKQYLHFMQLKKNRVIF